ncbi:FkbM family methyltransferase [Kitasatospora sp. RG8]|uniref:FkbM family methyltransferase n=1 Tax=Kitasatospora sp. RG8 TaxID=2820815 RepID=UPI001AE08A68|nr:FkbM family methyltransferase [Kitasatospora sp. RG8]MBP0454852.1 FkbM family methyltransferase [Kitasatospora sp. RG8]
MTSQYGQDRFVLRALNGMRGGFFLDSGASDGVVVSNTRVLEQAFGWTGICVEPNASLYAELVANRRCHCVNCCLYERDDEVEFVEAGTIGGILDEYHPALLDRARSLLGASPGGPPPTVRKPARTVRSVLREYGAPPVIDYWSLDTEGSELTILRSFPFDEYTVRVLTVEHNWLPARALVRRFLEARGFRWAAALGCDDCYVSERPGSVRPGDGLGVDGFGVDGFGPGGAGSGGFQGDGAVGGAWRSPVWHRR